VGRRVGLTVGRWIGVAEEGLFEVVRDGLRVGDTVTGPRVGDTVTGPRVGDTVTGPRVGDTVRVGGVVNTGANEGVFDEIEVDVALGAARGMEVESATG
jgi:hypothetical protein